MQTRSLKDKFTQKWKFNHHLLAFMPMESRVKFSSPQKHSWSFSAKWQVEFY